MDLTEYGRGLSGQGGANYGSAAWRAGDLERQRLENINRLKSTSSSNTIGSSTTIPGSGEPGILGTIFWYIFNFGLFALLFLYGFYKLAQVPEIGHLITTGLEPYIGDGKLITEEVFTGILIAISIIIGFFIRRFLFILNAIVVIGLVTYAVATP